MDERTVLELTDLAAVQLDCTACKATTVTIRVEAFKDPPERCPHCGTAWFKSRATEDMAVRQFVSNIREVATLEQRAPVRLRLELRAPAQLRTNH